MKKNILFVINLVLFVVTLVCMLFLFDKNISNVFAMESIEVNTEEGLTGNNENIVYNTVSENDRSNKEGVILGNERTLDFQDLTDVKYIDNAHYFLLNPLHGDNNKYDNIAGTCTTVATQMLMGYHNYFSDRRIIPDEANGKKFLDGNYGDIAYHPAFERNFVSSLGCKYIGTSDGFYQELFDLTPISEWPAIGQAAPFVVNGAKKFIEKYTPESARDNISISWNLFSKSIAQSEIDAGRPIILIYQPIMTGADSFHVVVAYGYGKLDGVDGFLVHYGWGDKRIQVWVPASWFGFQITMEVNHVHKFENEKIYKDAYVSKNCSICGLDTVDTLYDFSNGTINGLKYPLMGSINIPTTLNIYSTNTASFSIDTVNKIGANAFNYCTGINQISIPSSIVTIENKAFTHSDISIITFESGSRLQTIGESAFENCEMLGWVKGIELPASLENIGSRAFYSCNKLAKVVFANKSKLTSIGKNAFYNCAELAEVYIPANTTVIDDYAFYNCTNLRKIYFEKESKLISIGEKVFSHCTGLNKIEIPASVKELKFGAFYGCSALTDVTFEENSNLMTINSMAFYGCSSLNYNKEVPLEIPSKVTFIGDYAFSGCTSLRSITVPYMLNHLGNYAFANCTKLNVISIFSNLSFIGEGVFSGWTSNQTIHMVGIESALSGWSNLWHSECHAEIIWDADEIVTELFTYKFLDNETAYEVSLSYNVFQDDLPPILRIPSSYGGVPVKRIADNAFAFHSYIYNVEIPDSIVTIGYKAFYLCYDLENITFTSGSQLQNIKDYAFSGTKIEEITIPVSVISVGNNVFTDCVKLETISVESSNNNFSCVDGILYNKAKTDIIACPIMYTGNLVIPNTVTTIRDSAFASCIKLTSIYLHDNIDYIGEYAFYKCSALTEIVIPVGVNIIGYGAFFRCSALTTINVANANIAYSSYNGVLFNKDKSVLIYCPEAKSGNFIIPESVTRIDERAFDSCILISSITIPSNVKVIADYAFTDCYGLNDIIFEGDFEILSIGEFAFSGCSNLSSISLPYGLHSIGKYVFNKCYNLKNVYLPEGIAVIGDGAFNDCINLESMIIPDSVINLGVYIFENCWDMTEVKLPSGITFIPEGMFYHCSGFTEFELPTTVTSIGSYAFSGCANLSDITLSDSVSIIGNYAFKDCTALTTLDIPNKFINVDDNVFEGSGITNIVRLRYIFTEGILEVSNTFRIRLVFDNDPVGLTVNNITINGSSTGKLSGSGTERILELYNVTQQTLAVKVFGLPDAVIINGVKNAYIQSMSNVEYADVCVLLPYRGDYYADILYALEEKLILDERNLCVLNAEGNEYMQRDQLQTLIDLNKDTIILWEVFPGALNDLISEARQRGIRVLVFSWMEIETEADCLVMYDYYLAGYEMGYYLYEHGYESESNRIELFAANYDLYYTGFQSFLMGLNQAISENSNELEVVIHTLEDDGEIFQECYQIIVTHGIPCAVISFNDKFTEEVIACFRSYSSNITIFALTEDTNNLKLVEFGQINAAWYLGCEHIAETIMQFRRGDIEDDIYYLPFVKVDNVNMSDFVE